MLQSLDQYDTIDRWSHLPPVGGLSREQAILNDGARRMYVARMRAAAAAARARLTPWWRDSDVTLVATNAEVSGPRRLALPAPQPSRDQVN